MHIYLFSAETVSIHMNIKWELAPDLSGIDCNFLPELANYLIEKNLSTLLGLQVIDIDQNDSEMLELILPKSTIMLSTTDLHHCQPTR